MTIDKSPLSSRGSVGQYICVQHIDKYSVVESIAERLCQAEIKCIIIM
jgi:hypothetical protein